MEEEYLIPTERIYQSILVIRGRNVMLDADLANFYGVKTKRLNEQVKRNIDRFPEDFMFQLTEEEKQQVVANCDHLASLKFSRVNPYVFTEHGAIMLAAILNTPAAIKASVSIVRAFIRLRQYLIMEKDLNQKLASLEEKYDRQLALIFTIIDELIKEPEPVDRRPIGFKISESDASNGNGQ